MFHPQAALHFFTRVMRGYRMAPFLNMSRMDKDADEEFFGDGYMRVWVKAAQSHEYTKDYPWKPVSDNIGDSTSRHHDEPGMERTDEEGTLPNINSRVTQPDKASATMGDDTGEQQSVRLLPGLPRRTGMKESY
jgi:hypothetical protein